MNGATETTQRLKPNTVKKQKDWQKNAKSNDQQINQKTQGEPLQVDRIK